MIKDNGKFLYIETICQKKLCEKPKYKINAFSQSIKLFNRDWKEKGAECLLDT